MVTRHGGLPTPAFLPVATQATVKALSSADLVRIGVPGLLSNAYHLSLRPGMEIIRLHGGLHAFMRWDKPIVVDSGGFQIFSLAPLVSKTPQGVTFRSHIDGSQHVFTPESVVQLHETLGSDIGMVLDVCAPYPCEESPAREAVEMTLDWAERSKKCRGQVPLFCIVQGSTYPRLRRFCAEALVQMGFPGYAIGGLSVGEPPEQARESLLATLEVLPRDKPRYVMGVGTPEQVLDYVALGVDFFDCALPTRNARNGSVFTRSGKLTIRNASCARDLGPMDEACACWVCRTYTRSYIRHLFVSGEILAKQLATWHNLSFFSWLLGEARRSLMEGQFDHFKEEFLRLYRSGEEDVSSDHVDE